MGNLSRYCFPKKRPFGTSIFKEITMNIYPSARIPVIMQYLYQLLHTQFGYCGIKAWMLPRNWCRHVMQDSFHLTQDRFICFIKTILRNMCPSRITLCKKLRKVKLPIHIFRISYALIYWQNMEEFGLIPPVGVHNQFPPQIRQYEFYSCRTINKVSLPLGPDSNWTGWCMGTNVPRSPLLYCLSAKNNRLRRLCSRTASA